MVLFNSFGVLQQFSASVTNVDLCTSMDLCALVTEDSLSLHRTITWERTYYAKISEVFDDKTLTAVQFGAIGKILTLGFSDGTVYILDIETADVMACRRVANAAEHPVVSLAWQRLPAASGTLVDTPALALFGGLNQLQRGGMAEYSDPNSLVSTNGNDTISLSLTSPVAARRELTAQLAGHLLLSLTADRSVHGHLFGVFPLFSIDLSALPCPTAGLIAMHGQSKSVLVRTESGAHILPFAAQLSDQLHWVEHAASLHLCIESNLSRLQELVISCGKKWKDACKVVLPKLSLMQTLLATYELQMTPIEFCYTISMCGLWHPAAATAFTQHWNDQGIQRLRATVDATSRSIVKLLQTKALPMANNCLLCARELLGVTEQLGRTSSVTRGGGVGVSAQELVWHKQLVQRVERVVTQLDDALLEARLAREAMLLYIQFIKDCAYDAALSENAVATTIPGTKPDISLREKYQALFDPRCRRAPSAGATAQAEHVVGTHLYAFLQEQVVPVTDPCAGEPTQMLTDLDLSVGAVNLSALYKTASGLADQHMSACIGNTSHASTLEAEQSRSLVREIKAAKELEQSLFFGIHARTSASLLRDAPAASNSVLTHIAAEAEGDGSHELCAVTNLTLQVANSRSGNEESVELVQALVQASVLCENGVLQVSVAELAGDVSASTGRYFAAQVSLQSLAAGLHRPGGDASAAMDTSGEESNGSTVAAAKVCVYTRPVPRDDGKGSNSDVSILLLIEVPSEGIFLCKLALEEVAFHAIHQSTAAARSEAVSALPMSEIPEEALRSRKLSLRSVGRLHCSAERGVALVGDATRRVVIVDVEAEEDEEDEDEDDGEDGESGGAEESAGMGGESDGEES